MKFSVEPYFVPANDSEFLQAGESWIDSNQRFRQEQKYQFFRNAIDYIIDNDLAGSYLEFGVHRARTFTMAMSLDAFYAAKKGPTGGVLVPREGGGTFLGMSPSIHSLGFRRGLMWPSIQFFRPER